MFTPSYPLMRQADLACRCPQACDACGAKVKVAAKPQPKPSRLMELLQRLLGR